MKDPKELRAWESVIRRNFSLLFCPKYSFLDVRLNDVLRDRKD